MTVIIMCVQLTGYWGTYSDVVRTSDGLTILINNNNGKNESETAILLLR